MVSKSEGMGEPYKILSEFLELKKSLRQPPKRRSNSRLVGKLFTTLLFRRIEEYVPKQYSLVQQEMWIRGLEWIEWDGAIVLKPFVDKSLPVVNPSEVVALFEVKVRGIYGGKEVCKRSLRRIRENFQTAVDKCGSNLHCIYVTLQERTPKDERSVKYKCLTEEILEPVCLPIMLFRSPLENKPVVEAIPYPGQWERLIEEVSQLR